MKYSMCTVFAKERPVEEILDMAAALELDGVELWDGHVSEYAERTGGLQGLKTLLEERGLECVVISPYFNLLCAEKVEESLARARQCVEYAKGLDCGIIRVFVGDKGSAQLSPIEWASCADGLRRLAALARENGLVIGLENHNNMPPDTKEAVLRLLKAVDSPELRLIFDGFNFYPDGNDMAEAHEYLKDYIVHYHFKNLLWMPHLCVPLDAGDADFAPLIQAIKATGYDGYISFEYFAADPSDMIRASWAWFRKVYDEA